MQITHKAVFPAFSPLISVWRKGLVHSTQGLKPLSTWLSTNKISCKQEICVSVYWPRQVKGHGPFNVALYAFFRHSILHEFPPPAARKEIDNTNDNNHTNKIRDNRDRVLTQCEGFDGNQGKRNLLQGIFLETNGAVKFYASDKSRGKDDENSSTVSTYWQCWRRILHLQLFVFHCSLSIPQPIQEIMMKRDEKGLIYSVKILTYFVVEKILCFFPFFLFKMNKKAQGFLKLVTHCIGY